MINPGERFDAFTSNRLAKKDNGVAYELSSSYTLGPKTHALFTFFHLLNRSVTSTPWIFYISMFFTFIQIWAAAVEPYNSYIWQTDDEKLKIFLKILTIVIRYVPSDTSQLAEFIVFAVATICTFAHFILFIVIVFMLKAQKNTIKQLNFFFIYSFLIYPIFRSCFITVTANFLRAIFTQPSIGTFFVSAISLVVIALMVFMAGLCAFATGSSPSPNISNPTAIWAPNTWESVFFDLLIVIGLLIIELESTAKRLVISILLIVRFVILITLVFLHIDKIYYIRFSAYQFVSCMFLTFDIYMIVLIILSFKPRLIPFAGIISIWAVLPLICYILLKIRCMHTSKSLLKKLKSVEKPEIMPKQGTKAEEEIFSDIYSVINLKTSRTALMAVRTACYWSLDCFADCSLLKYVIHTFPDLQFQMLYMAFLIPDNIGYLKTLIDSFLSKQNPSFLQAAILYQLLSSIQESSNEGCQAISREISKQTLASIKCEQVLSKFWSGCYKGDISQMARSAFTLHQNLKELSESWKQLVIRYPYSMPILKEYIKYLVGVGMQHRIAESILKIHPKLMDNVQSNNSPDANEINESILHQSVEDAVDRRPVISLRRARAFIIITVFLAFLFIICAIVLAFIFINISYGMSNYLYYSDTTCSLIVHSPNLLQKIIVSGTAGRKSFFNHAKTLDSSITGLLSSMPSVILRNNSVLSEKLYSQVNYYNVSSKSGLVKALRLYSYYARSVPFVTENDTLVFLMSKNTFGIAYSVFLASDAELSSIQNLISKVKKYIPIYYGVIWGVMLIIMIPFVFNALQNVKSELKYIFNLYLSIPRSVITEFMDPDYKNKKGKTGGNITSTFLDLDQNDVNNQATANDNENKAAENLKLLVHDQSTSQSVLPNNFQIKVWIILSSVTFTLLIGATIEVSMFTSFVNEMMVEFKTLQILSRRIIGCSVALQGIVSNFSDFPRPFCENLLNSAKKQNSQLLLAIDKTEVSQKFLTYKPVYNFVHSNKCNDTSNVSCWSYANLMDTFLIFATQAYNNSISDENLLKWIVLYNDYLYPESYELHTIGYYFIIKQFKTERLILLLIFFLFVGIVALVAFIFLSPTIKRLNNTIQAVKLPMKYIPPIKIPDLAKIMLYLQGEADWHKDGFIAESNNSTFGNYLSLVEYPHAIFEEDRSLLFANNGFYSLIGAPREACIGLSIDAIFSRIMDFKNEPKHPFNKILEFMDQDTNITCVKVTTKFERGTHKSKNVEIRMSKVIADDNKNAFILAFEDLTYHYQLEENSRYQRQFAENLKHNAIPLLLSNALMVGNKLQARDFHNAGMSVFAISYASLRDEYDGELADGCLIFLKAAQEVSGVFPNIVKLMNEPPNFIFLSIPDENDPVDIRAIQMVHFMNAIINSFNSSTQKFKISAVMLIGDITVIPMKTALPVLEVFGSGYRVLMANRHKVRGTGKFFITKDTAPLLSELKSVTLTDDRETELVIVSSKHIDE